MIEVSALERSKITDIVEDYWRAFITAMQLHGSDAASNVSHEFDGRIAEASRALGPMEALSFAQAVEADREKLMAEYVSDPGALKRRLGLSLGTDRKTKRRSGGQELGNLAVRTAVRATVWESVRAIFRLFR